MKFKNRIIIWVLAITFIPLCFSYTIFLKDKVKTDTINIENNLLEAASVAGNNIQIRKKIAERTIDGTVERKVEEYIQIFRDVDIIVVADINGIKYSHLDKNQIGDSFINPVQWNMILKGEGYFSKMKGSMGITFRRFEPLYNLDENKVIGFVMVGKYNHIIKDMNAITFVMFTLLFIASLFMSLLLAITFASRMKKSLFGLDPEEIGRLYVEEKLIIDNLESGLIALNTQNKILKVNSVFLKKYSKFSSDEILEKMKKYLEIKENKVRYVDVLIDGERLYIKVLPIYNLEEYFGTILLIKKKDDVNNYAREITGMDLLIEGMRANIHEFKNRLHVILGLINLDKIDMVKKYILEIQELNEYDFRKLKNIKNSFLKAILLGKDSVCKERKIEFIVDLESEVLEERRTNMIEDISTIVGNLIENSIDSFSEVKSIDKKIKVKLVELENEIEIEVWDNGEKIPQEYFSKIYNYGFSTKGNHRGVGLFLIKEKLDIYNGTIQLEQSDNYKIFKVRMEKINEKSIGC